MQNNIISVLTRKRRNMYEVCVRYIGEDGKEHQKIYEKFNKKREAEKYVVELKSAINNDRFQLPKNFTFVDRCIKYYDDKSHEYSPKTLNNAYAIINKHIKSFFENVKLTDITISMYQDFMNYVGRLDLSDATKKKIYQISNAVLRECYRLQEINTNIPEFITKPKTISTTDTDIYTLDEIRTILDNCQNTKFLDIPINLFLFAGMRFGEIAGLCWEDIDFQNNTLHVNKNLIYENGQYYMRRPKIENGVRDIIVPDAIIHMLKSEKIRQNKLILQGLYKKNDFDVVCLNSELKYLSLTGFVQSYKRFLKKINIRYIRPHKLRHAHATLLLMSGVDMKTVSERLGHSKIEITMDTYSHVLREMDKKASDNIEKLLL